MKESSLFRKIILSLTLAVVLSGLTPATAEPSRPSLAGPSVRVTTERHVGYSITGIRVPNDGKLYQVGNVSLQTMPLFTGDGWITAGDTICWLKVYNPVVEGSGFGPIIALKGNVDCRYWPTSYGVGVPAPMIQVIVNTWIQEWSGPGLYENHWNTMRPGKHFEWTGFLLKKPWWHPVSGCFLAYQAPRFRQAMDASGRTGEGLVAWPQVGYSNGNYLPGCATLHPPQVF